MPGPNDSILATVGRTPVVRLNRLAPDGVELHAKLEAFNPMGSVKDRLALGVIEAAERAGELSPGQTVVEATSGNTGIGLAMVCAAKGYPLVVTMAENFSVERRRLMRFLGARVLLTPAADKGTGMVAKARELAAEHGWFLTRQFENEANADIHVRTTAEEILADFAGRRLDWFVTGAGTGGTLKGVAKVLKARRPEVRIAVCEPDNAPVLASGIPQERNSDGSAATSHPSFRPHVMQGWAPDFIPKLTGDALAAGHVDRIVAINGGDALRLSRELARQEGIFCGISGGATLAGALELAAGLPPGAAVLFMVPDTGERYLSTPLFQDIPETMTEEEEALAASTPGYRIHASAAAAPAAGREPSARAWPSSSRCWPIRRPRSCFSRSNGASSAGRSGASSTRPASSSGPSTSTRWPTSRGTSAARSGRRSGAGSARRRSPRSSSGACTSAAAPRLSMPGATAGFRP